MESVILLCVVLLFVGKKFLSRWPENSRTSWISKACIEFVKPCRNDDNCLDTFCEVCADTQGTCNFRYTTSSQLNEKKVIGVDEIEQVMDLFRDQFRVLWYELLAYEILVMEVVKYSGYELSGAVEDSRDDWNYVIEAKKTVILLSSLPQTNWKLILS